MMATKRTGGRVVANEIATRIVKAAERSQSETGRYVIPDAVSLGVSLGGAVRKTGEIRDRHPSGEELHRAVSELVVFIQAACEFLGARVVPEKPVRKSSGKKTARKKRSVRKKGRKKRWATLDTDSPLTDRFSLIVEALARLRSRSCIIDGEAVCCDRDGIPSFDRLR